MADDAYEMAIKEAEAGAAEGGVPIGATLTRDGKVVGRGHNRRVQHDDPTAHAEIECLRDAGRIGSLKDAVLYTTLTPCYLCTGAIILFGIPRVVVGETHSYDGDGSLELLRRRGVEVTVLEDAHARTLMRTFMESQPELWAEDIGS
jgi:creatinine deaminase